MKSARSAGGRARETQVALDRRHRDAERIGDFVLRQSHQQPQFDDAAFARILTLELLQRGFDAEPGVGSRHRDITGRAERHADHAAAALLGLIAADRIDQCLAQRQRRGAEEMDAVARGERPFEQARERFVHELGGLQRLRLRTGQAPRRHAVQLVVYQRGERARRRRIAVAPRREQLRHIAGTLPAHGRDGWLPASP